MKLLMKVVRPLLNGGVEDAVELHVGEDVEDAVKGRR